MHSHYSFYSSDRLWMSKDLCLISQLTLNIIILNSLLFLLQLCFTVVLNFSPICSTILIGLHSISTGFWKHNNVTSTNAICLLMPHLTITWKFSKLSETQPEWRAITGHLHGTIKKNIINNPNNFWSSSNNRDIQCYDSKREYDNRLIKLFTLKWKVLNEVYIYFTDLWI
jgi:hypothetical protein